jgi:predicted kinase
MEDTQVISDTQRLKESLGQLPEPVVQPVFIVVSGLPGTGKSYFCDKLAERLPVITLKSDALRKVLFSSPAYSPQESSRLFQAIHHLIGELLEKGISLILDATNLSEHNRERLYNIADRLNARLILVRVEAPVDVVHKRLKARAGGINPEDPSDADWKVYQRLKPTVQKIHRNHYAVDTSRDINPVLAKIIREVNR